MNYNDCFAELFLLQYQEDPLGIGTPRKHLENRTSSGARFGSIAELIDSIIDKESRVSAEIIPDCAVSCTWACMHQFDQHRITMSRTKNNKPGSGKLGSEKRKREDDETEQPAKKPQRQSRAQRKAAEAARPEQTECDTSIATQSPEDLAERFSKAIKKHKGDLSTIELEDLSILSKAFRDTTSFAQPRLAQNLPKFLTANTQGGKASLSKCDDLASPHTLLVTFSAIRACDLIRAVRDFGSEENKISKLFAKHMKLPQMVDYAKKTRFGIGAGTPKRLEDLITDGALKIEKLKRVVVDASYTNEKKATIFDEKDGFDQMVSLLNNEKLKLQLVSGQTEILVF